MSTVDSAEDHLQGIRTIAVKLFNSAHDDVLKQELFRREIRALSRVEHPSVVEVLDSGWSEEHQCSFLVLEYLPRTLLHEIEAHHDDPEQSWLLMHAMADSLAHAYSEGIVREVHFCGYSSVSINTKLSPEYLSCAPMSTDTITL